MATRTLARRRTGQELHTAREQTFKEWGVMFADWWGTWRDVFRARSLPQDLIAGLTVAAVALPLNLALAVVSGLPPIAGLIAGALGGAIAAIFGGAPLQVTGPAAALNVLVLAVVHDFGTVGVAAAALIVGVCQIGLGLARAGRLAEYVPESVLVGFTTGVGLKLLDSQIPEVLGFDYKVVELGQMMHRPAWLHHVSWLAAMCGVFVAFVVTATRQYKRFPGAIVGIGLITFVAYYLKWDIERIGAVPSSFPPPTLPIIADEKWIDLIGRTAPLVILASVECLLSARAVDRMANAKKLHNPNVELVGQGLANTAVGLMSGMPVTGVIVRSGVNVQSGARTRLSALIHAVFLALVVLVLSKHIAHVPLAALAGLLCVVGFRLVELHTLAHLFRTSKIEAAAFVVTAAGTVSGYLMTGLVGGLVLHAVHRFFHRHEAAEQAQLVKNKKEGVRAVVEQTREQRKEHGFLLESEPTFGAWLSHIRERVRVPSSAYLHPQASVIGKVVLGDHVHIAAGSSVRADEGSPFYIGPNTNIQDGVVIHALKDKRVLVGDEKWAVYVGRNVSIAHNALVHGPCYIGDDTFIGFKAVVHDAIVGSRCFIGIGAVVVGVEIPDGRLVPHGRIVDTADAVDSLPAVTAVHSEFNQDVVEVNRGLAVAYRTNTERPYAPRKGGFLEPRRFPVWDAAWETTTDKDRF